MDDQPFRFRWGEPVFFKRCSGIKMTIPKLNKKILVVDDDASHRRMLEAVLSDEGYDIVQSESGEDAVGRVREMFYDLVLMDIRMRKMSGIEALKKIKGISPQIPVVIMTAYASVGTAVDALKSGAYDYLTKPLDIDELKLLVEKALHHHQLKEENINMKERLDERFDFSRIIGKSRAIQDMFETMALIAPSDATVLITGESGTGKELIANALHQNSPRRDNPFITVNCAALPENLLESELFGHVKGAYTGADSRRKGRFHMADTGSVFLDEIGEMPLVTQAKILRVLQEHEFEPLGTSDTVKVNTRVISASNKNLEEEVRKGNFREDLYYRLNVVNLNLVPLRDRVDDIPLLVDCFLKKYAKKNMRLIKALSPEAMDLMMRHQWPGNVRELENVIERAVILSRGDIITPAEFPATLKPAEVNGDMRYDPEITPGMPLKAVEKRMILKTLGENDGNRTRTAEILGISRRTLQLKLKEYGKDSGQ
jgi:two-component system, NtrC family, response regulator HydG